MMTELLLDAESRRILAEWILLHLIRGAPEPEAIHPAKLQALIDGQLARLELTDLRIMIDEFGDSSILKDLMLNPALA